MSDGATGQFMVLSAATWDEVHRTRHLVLTVHKVYIKSDLVKFSHATIL